MKGIILAAGMGTRLNKYTENLPKGMLEVKGKSLIEHQIETMRSLGIEKIVIIKGYMPDKISFRNVVYYTNKEYETTNMVESLFCALKEFNDDCIVTYSDIMYEDTVLTKAIRSQCNIGVVVDCDFEEYWKARLGTEYREDMESLIVEREVITSLGKDNPKLHEVNGRYVGILKFSKKGISDLSSRYFLLKEENKISKYGNRPFEKWYMTDLIQNMIDKGHRVEPINISRGWLELDRNEDFEKLNSWLKTGRIDNFIKI